MPGGADLPYCKELNGKGNAEIVKYVRSGGKYLGLCAGGYYGSARVEFEVGDPRMEVSGSRELQFFPGVARGAVYKGFDYSSPVNAKASKCYVVLENFELSKETAHVLKHSMYIYVHGGCLFVDAEQLKSRGIEVLARYLDPMAVRGSDISNNSIDAKNPAAAVYCRVGRGCAVLTGLHPEFSPDLLKSIPGNKEYSSVIDTLATFNLARVEFIKAILQKMGLKVNMHEVPVPSLSRLCLTSSFPQSLEYIIEGWRKTVGLSGELHNVLKGNNDTFRIWNASRHEKYKNSSLSATEKRYYDTFEFDKIVKDIDVYHTGVPDNKVTPLFNHTHYYNSLLSYRTALGPGMSTHTIGNTLLYGEVVTSTSTMLFKNLNLLKTLPTGFTAVGTVQVAGRGRANNVWVSPFGVLAFSTVLRIPLQNELGTQAPMVFVQYLAAIVIVEAIKSYAKHHLGIADFPVYIKWPNDIYILNPLHKHLPNETTQFFKVSGILVNTTVINSEFLMVVGIGINVDNHAPSKSLNTFIDETNEYVRKPKGKSLYGHFQMETLLAKFMVIWELKLRDFMYQGFAPFEHTYYKLWLHNHKIVTLEQYENVKAIIRGVSKDYGMLVVEEVDRNNRPLGKIFELQPDGNSFDMLKGLLKKKT